MKRRPEPPKAGFRLGEEHERIFRSKKSAQALVQDSAEDETGEQENSLMELYRESERAKHAKPASQEEIDAREDSSEELPLKKEKPSKKTGFLDSLNEKPSKARGKNRKDRTNQPKFYETKAFKTALKIGIPVLVGAGLVFVCLLVFLQPETTETPEETPQEEVVETKPDNVYYSKLSGLETARDKLNEPTTCIMIENSPEARPQSGLDQAGVVYEAIAEGGITRFMGVFQDTKPQYLGPVRSVRLTYAEIARSYNCSIAHVGGSKNALSLIRNNAEYRDIDQFFNADSYWRITERWAPHNVYTSFEALDNLNKSKGYTSSDFKGFERVNADAEKTTSDKATRITIEMSSALYNPVYSYDSETNSYTRAFETGEPHMVVDENGIQTQLAPTVVIAIETDAVLRTKETRGYMDYRTTGEGKATIFQNGDVIEGKWKRDNQETEFSFYDASGEKVKLNRGQTWISIFPAGNSVTWE